MTGIPSITRAEVAHLARLSRFALGDDELHQMAGELEVLIGSVRLKEVAGPTCHRLALGAAD